MEPLTIFTTIILLPMRIVLSGKLGGVLLLSRNVYLHFNIFPREFNAQNGFALSDRRTIWVIIYLFMDLFNYLSHFSFSDSLLVLKFFIKFLEAHLRIPFIYQHYTTISTGMHQQTKPLDFRN